MSEYKNNIVSGAVFVCALIMVLISLVSVIFPALILSNYGSIQNNIEPFELGNNAALLIIINVILFSLGYLYYKRHSKAFSNIIDRIRRYDVSKRVAVIASIVILAIYIGLTIPELYLDEDEQFPDYEILVNSLQVFPSTDTGNVFYDEQNRRYVRMLLLGASQDYLQNVKVVPFLASILLVVFTGLTTIAISHKRTAGILAMIILLQGYTFLEYDTIAVYENIWVLFFLLSIYAINRRWYLSGFWYVLSVFTKAFSTPFLAMNIFYALRSDESKSYKVKILLSYLVAAIVILSLFAFGNSIYDDFINIDFNRFANSLSDLSSQLRFDYFLLFTLLPITVGLYFLGRNGVKHADSLLFLIFGLILAGPLVSLVTDFYVILPYRFVPLLVFFSVAVGLLVFKNPKFS